MTWKSFNLMCTSCILVGHQLSNDTSERQSLSVFGLTPFLFGNLGSSTFSPASDCLKVTLFFT